MLYGAAVLKSLLIHSTSPTVNLYFAALISCNFYLALYSIVILLLSFSFGAKWKLLNILLVSVLHYNL